MMKNFTLTTLMLVVSLKLSAQCGAVTSATVLKSCLENPPYTATLAASFGYSGAAITIPDGAAATLNLNGFDVTWSGTLFAFANPGVSTTLTVTNGTNTLGVVKNSPGAGQITVASFNALGSAAAAVPAPVELYRFSAKLLPGKSTAISLQFSTATEQNNAYFAVERSADGHNFVEIGKIEGAINSVDNKDYAFTDERPLPGKSYYRLQQVDFDGQSAFSKIVSIVNGRAVAAVLSPLPVQDQLTLQLSEAIATNSNWEILDNSGRAILNGGLEEGEDRTQIDVSSLETGSYFLRIVSARETISKQFVKF